MALFPGQPGWAGARRELVDFMVQGKINRGRHTDHPAGRHSIWTNQCPPPWYTILVCLLCKHMTTPQSGLHLQCSCDSVTIVSAFMMMMHRNVLIQCPYHLTALFNTSTSSLCQNGPITMPSATTRWVQNKPFDWVTVLHPNRYKVSRV